MKTAKKKSTFIDFKEVKALTDFKDLLTFYELEMEEIFPGQFGGICPFCDSEEDEPFRVNLEKGCFNCFACEGEKTGGNVFDFVMWMEDCSIREAALFLVEKIELPIASKKRRKTKTGKRRSLNERSEGRSRKRTNDAEGSQRPQRAIEENSPLTFSLELQTDHPWFAENGIPEEVRKQFGLGFCHRGTMKGRIAFPVQSEHGVLGYIGLWPDESLPDNVLEWLFPKPEDFNPQLEIFGFHESGDVGDEGIEVVSSPLEVVRAAVEGIKAIHFLGGAVTSHQAIKLVSKFS